jgi:hypothetical protein
MGFEEIKDKALELVHGHKDEVEGGVDKAADLAKDKVGHDDQVDQAAEFAKHRLENL